MDNVTRRSFLVKGSAGAVGLATTSSLIGTTVAGAATKADEERELTPQELADAAGPIVVEIRDAATGQIALLVRDEEILLTDRRLVAKVLRAAR